MIHIHEIILLYVINNVKRINSLPNSTSRTRPFSYTSCSSFIFPFSYISSSSFIFPFSYTSPSSFIFPGAPYRMFLLYVCTFILLYPNKANGSLVTIVLMNSISLLSIILMNSERECWIPLVVHNCYLYFF